MKERKTPALIRRRPINKRPGRCVCICTTKGKIIYMEDQFTYNKKQQEIKQ